MTEIPDSSVHLVVTSPPYNVECNYHTYKDNLDFDSYLQLLSDVWDECDRVLVPGGRIAVNVPFGTGRSPYVPLYSHLIFQLNHLFNLKGTIVWKKPGTSKLTSWGSWLSPSSPCLRDQCEAIIVAQKGGQSECFRGKSPFLDPDTFLELTQDFWEVKPETSLSKYHPAPYPISIPSRLMRLYAFPGATILDPFAGSGTTGVAANQLFLDCWLYDVDPTYCELARQRVAQEELFSYD